MKWEIIVSALLYGASFFYVQQLWWCTLFFLVPIFYAVAKKKQLTFFDGFLWGLIAYTIVFSFLGRLLHYRAAGQARHAWYLLLVCYIALYAGLWFLLARKLGNGPLGWVIATSVHWYVLKYYSWWPVGRADGFPFLSPFVPLAERPFLIKGLPFFGETVYEVSLVMLSSALVFFLVERRKVFLLLLCIGMVPFTGGLFYQEQREIKLEAEDFAYIPAPRCDHLSYNQQHLHKWDAIEELVCSIEAARKCHPQARVLLSPESSCRFALNKQQHMLEALCRAANPAILLCGSHKIEGLGLYNSLYIGGGLPITTPYDKTHQIPFVEYLPFPWSWFPNLRTLFLSQAKEFCASPSYRDKIISLGFFEFVPMICSDLFFCTRPPENRVPVVALVNDGWFVESPYFQRILWLIARIKSKEWGLPLVYIAHSGGWILNGKKTIKLS